METNTRVLFEKIQSLLNFVKEQQAQAKKRGENYNIFETLRLTTRETRLHSAVIADLLNPEGNHALGVQPLMAFLKVANIREPFTSADIENAKVEVEHCIGTISDDQTEGGNIDILITIGNYCIIIENKIYAGDQPTQLLRYHNFCNKSPHTLLYLTLDGHEASEKSAMTLNVEKDYFCMSYQNEITKWLTKCISIAATKPLVRETLQQYLNIILKLTSQNMDNNDRNTLFELMSDYPEVVTSVVNNQWNYRIYLVKTYLVEPFTNWCKSSGYEWYEAPDFQNQAKGIGFGIYRLGWNKMIAVDFTPHESPSYGVYIWNSKDTKTCQMIGSETNEAWPYGWEHFDKYTDWDIVSLSKELKEGKVFEYVCQKFSELIEKIDSNPDLYPMI